MKPKKGKEANVGRALTSQEESILLPLIQGLLAANASESALVISKHENSPLGEKESSTKNTNNNKSTKENNETSEFHTF